jgi:hypothetical protein
MVEKAQFNLYQAAPIYSKWESKWRVSDLPFLVLDEVDAWRIVALDDRGVLLHFSFLASRDYMSHLKRDKRLLGGYPCPFSLITHSQVVQEARAATLPESDTRCRGVRPAFLDSPQESF